MCLASLLPLSLNTLWMSCSGLEPRGVELDLGNERSGDPDVCRIELRSRLLAFWFPLLSLSLLGLSRCVSSPLSHLSLSGYIGRVLSEEIIFGFCFGLNLKFREYVPFQTF